MATAVNLQNITVKFKTSDNEVLTAVKNVNLTVQKGDIFGIVGYSGAGKSTLVRTINLLQHPTSGKVQVGDTTLYDNGKQIISRSELSQERRRIGMIFQHFNLLNESTVGQNIWFALKHSTLSSEQKEKRVIELLDLVGLKDKIDVYPIQLSGGEQQRVAIARALANNPEILISDEATSALDPQNTVQILDLLKKLNHKYGLTIVLITHEMDAVKRIANKIAVMSSGEIIEQGNLLDVYLHPKKHLTQQFVGGAMEAETVLQTVKRKLDSNERIFQITFSANTLGEAIILSLYKKIGVEVSIIYGNMEILNGQPVGTMYILVRGTDEQLQQVNPTLAAAGVVVTVINDRRN